jgi:hypothetical protein
MKICAQVAQAYRIVMRQCTKQTRPPAQRVGNDNNNKSSRPFQREIAVRGVFIAGGAEAREQRK